MLRLTSPKRKILRKAGFDKYPVWVWDDEMESKVPISNIEPSWYDFGVFFIKCNFIISGHSFDGYLIGNDHYYAIVVFTEDKEFVLNKNAPDLNEIALKTICKILHRGSLPLYPIFYRSEVHFKENGEISDILDFRRNN